MVPFLRPSVLWLWLPLLSNMIDASPADRADVMALVRTSSDLFCNRHCWNRKPCTNYSFVSLQNGPYNNCVLHAAVLATSADPTPASDGSWHTIPATNRSDSKCQTRPCQEWEKCVAPMVGNWYFCTDLTLPQCSRKPAVPHASVSVTGWPHQGDKAVVSCDEPYIMSPKKASTEITCQGTSQWTPFEGECVPYEFNYPGGISSFERDLPWPLEDSEICVEGVITGQGFAYVDLMSSLSATLIDFRLQIFTWWSTSLHWTQNYPRGSEEYKKSYHIRSLNMRVGDTIRLSISLWHGLVKVETTTGARGFVPNYDENSYDISQSKAIAFSGLINITYINLLSGC